jgi:hypothetical protein
MNRKLQKLPQEASFFFGRIIDTCQELLVDGPRVLGQISPRTNALSVVKPALQIMAHLHNGAPQHQALQLARELIASQDSSGLAGFLAPGSDTTCSAALVRAKKLIQHLAAVMFCNLFDDNNTVIFLHGMAIGLLAAHTTLASSLSAVTASLTGRWLPEQTNG